ILGRDVHRHVVVQDLDRQVFPLLTEDCAGLFLHDGACTVVRIHHLVADLVQADPPLSSLTSPERRRAEPRRRHHSGYQKVAPKAQYFQGFSTLDRKSPAQSGVLLSVGEARAGAEASLARPVEAAPASPVWPSNSGSSREPLARHGHSCKYRSTRL